MNVLIIGSGGREHAIAWKIAQSPGLENLYIAPGNAGTAMAGVNIPLDPLDFAGIGDFAINNHVAMVIVGPEVPLVNGIRDFFDNNPELRHISLIGPSKRGAMLEGSKDFAKAFMQKYNIPTAQYRTFTTGESGNGCRYLDNISPPFVLKADGLAAGKGVIITSDVSEAKKVLVAMLDEDKFGEAGQKVVVENYLEGIEVSVFVVTDGKHWVLLPEAKDYKRIGERDTGPNTGGMGSISPVPFTDEKFMQKVMDRIIQPTVDGIRKENIVYNGFIFFGLMNSGGDPYVIEYNCRLGDPESEAIIPRIKSDLLTLLEATANNRLKDQTIEIDPRIAASVFLVSEGYPDAYEKGKIITGFGEIQDSILFHAGTRNKGNKILTNGGRVIAVTSMGKDIREALAVTYKNVQKIGFVNKYYRRDIGSDLLSL